VFGNATGTLALQSGAGLLVFGGGDSPGSTQASSLTSLTIGSGGADIFGMEGDSISLYSSGNGAAVFAAGIGNETLNAAGFSSNLTIYADNPADTLSATGEALSVVGGSGTNVFLTGAGAESLVGGSGVNDFDLSKTIDGLGGTLTIFNYTASDYITFSGFTAADEQAAIASAVATTNGLVGTQILLSDNTTVLFVDANPSDLKFVT
jgi:Ca2+-binding RTX toxin-like protein